MKESFFMTLETLMLVIGFPFIVPLVSTAIVWKKLNRRWLFLVVSFLSLAFIGDMTFAILHDLIVPDLPHPIPPNSLSLSVEQSHGNLIAMIATDAIVLVLGIPLIAWLFSALKKPALVAA
jgi:hypothetical protein